MAAPAGLSFSANTGAFYVVDRSSGRAAATDVVTLKPFELRSGSDRSGSARLSAAIDDPINVVFDPAGNRLLLVGRAGQLLEVGVTDDGEIDARTLQRRDALRVGLKDARGMAVDPATGTVFVLDGKGPRIVRVEPGGDGSLVDATVSEIDLARAGLADVRGLAFDPSTGHLHLRDGETLYELTPAGDVVATRDLSGTELVDPQGLVFGPSADQTDPPTQTSLYVADSGGGALRSSGQVVELSLVPFPGPESIDSTSTLVGVVDTATWNPPSPDPSGIAYLPGRDRLMMADGEVEETVSGITHFQGANVWEFTRSGAVLRTANISTVPPTTTPMTDEPTGVAFKGSPATYFYTDDGRKRVYTLDPGADLLVGTVDDAWNYFSTSTFGNGDPEGIAYDALHDRVFVADGVNAEIYQYTTTGSLVGQFDVARYGVADPEGVEFDPVSGTLFTLSNKQSGPIVVETTTDGTLVRTIDVSAILSAGGRKPAGLTLAPASDGSAADRFYVVDRGVDNNSNPSIVDGKMFELTSPAPVGNQPPSVEAGPEQSITLPATATLDGTVSDDGLPSPPGAVTTSWTMVSGPGAVTFGDASKVDTTASFSTSGVYVLRLTANDGALVGYDELTVNVAAAGSNQAPTVDAGLDQSITLPATATLDGTVSDDGLPSPPGAVTTSWTMVSGPGAVTFGDASKVDTTASFSTSGVYVLRLTADDGAHIGTDELTVTVDPPASGAGLYLSLRDNTTIGGLDVRNEDVVLFDGGSGFSLAFDGSDVGIAPLRIDAFARLDALTLLFSFDSDKTVPGIGLVDDSDIVKFKATSLGDVTAGVFSLYFDGSDVGLTTSAHDVDAFELLPDGRLVISTTGSVTVGGVAARDEDLLAFSPTSLGDVTAGTFSLYFDGSDVGLGDSGEDVDAVAIAPSGALYLSAPDAFAVPGVSGQDEDVFLFTPVTLGQTTSGTYSPTLRFDGSAFGLAANDVFAIQLP